MPGSLIKTSNNPDFYFEEPDYINVKKDIFETIYDFFVGSNEERWIIGYAQ